MLTRRDARGCKSHTVIVSIIQYFLRVSVDISVGKYVLLYAVLLIFPSVHFVHLVRPLIYRSIDISIY